MDLDEVGEWKTKIDKCSREDMGTLIRNFPPGEYPFFKRDTPTGVILWDYFFARWHRLGGWSGMRLKEMGW